MSSIPCASQETVTIDANELKDILITEAQYKAANQALERDTANLRLIIKANGVKLANNEKLILNYIESLNLRDQTIEGLKRAVESTKIAYDDLRKNAKKNKFWKWLLHTLEGAVIGAGIAVGLIVL